MRPTVPRRLAAVVAVSLLGTGCGATGGSGPRIAGALDPALAGRLDAAIAGAMDAARVPGSIVGIWSPEGEYVKAFGVADTTTGSPMRTDFYHRIGSVTKTFTATAILQLVEAGKLGLDDPIGRHLPGVPNGETITVRRLATMRSGLPDYTDATGFQEAVAADPRRDFTTAELLGWAYRLPVQFPPGQRFAYSNTNYVLLGLLVEKAGGQPVADYLTANILAPLDLADTSLPGGTRFPDPHARGYTDPVDGPGPPVDTSAWTASLTWTAGGMISTLDDMHTWVPKLATGELLGPEMQRQRLRHDSDPGDFGYGIGVFTVAGWIGHNGSVPGYQTVAIYLPQRRMTVVVMINTDVAAPDGDDPSEVLATAITSVITPDHVYDL